MNAAALDLEPAIVVETPAHAAALERVLDRAFGPGRFAKTSERVRENGARHRLDLSRVALAAGEAIGCCRLHDIAVGVHDALFLGPLAVDPKRQHAGLGARLVAAAVEAALSEGRAIILVGAQSFFAPFGFTKIPPGRVVMPGPVDPDRFLWFGPQREILSGAISAPRGASRS